MAARTLLIAGISKYFNYDRLFLGLIAGYSSLFSHLIMRIADVIMSFLPVTSSHHIIYVAALAAQHRSRTGNYQIQSTYVLHVQVLK